MEQVLTTLLQANPGRLPVDFIVQAENGRSALLIDIPPSLQAVVVSQLHAAYPDAQLVPAQARASTAKATWHLCLQAQPDSAAIKSSDAFIETTERAFADPLAALLLALESTSVKGFASATLRLRPAAARDVTRAKRLHRLLETSLLRRWNWVSSRLWRRVRHARWPVRWPMLGLLRMMRRRGGSVNTVPPKLQSPLFDAALTIAVELPATGATTPPLKQIAAAYALFAVPGQARFRAARVGRGTVRHRRSDWFFLSPGEAALVWHPPTDVVHSPTLPQLTSREFEPPGNLPKPRSHASLTILGQTSFRRRKERFGLTPDDRARHLYLVGKTGVGKSTLLQQLVLSDIEQGAGVALLDPHGDLCESVVASVPANRTNDVIYFDPADTDWPIAFNLFDHRSAVERPLVASGILTAFRKIFGEFWGPRMEHLFRNALLALLETPNATLLHVPRMFADARFRAGVVQRLGDPVVKSFWDNEFDAMHPKLQVEASSPIYNKVGAFLSSPTLRNILGQSRGRLRIRSVMDSGQILLCNLSKGRIGEDASLLLGSLLVTEIQLAAMSRADQAEAERRPFAVYLDEFQNFATVSIATVLSEARKYRTTFILAHQFIDQIDDDIAAAIFGNVGNLICFQAGRDAEELAEHLGSPVIAEDLRFLPKYHAVARLLTDGVPTRPFTMTTIPPRRTPPDRRRAEAIRRATRERYARPLAMVEREIAEAVR